MKKKEVELRADYLFEVSWEVCNKIGGIYTVLKSKVTQTIKQYGNEYCLVGPYFNDKVKGEFEELVIPAMYHGICAELEQAGVVLHYGKWLTDGNPNVILLDFQPLMSKKDEIKRIMWDDFRLDSIHSDFEFDEPAVFAWAAGMAIDKFANLHSKKRICSLFHEWLSGAGILYLKHVKSDVGTIFVTHATVTGRYLVGKGMDLYMHVNEDKPLLETLDFDRECYNGGVSAKHNLEKASAHNADVFSTVSEITGIEAEHILKKKPDILLPNGLNIGNFPTVEENSIKHKILRDKIYHFLLYYFFPYYHLDIEDTLIYFIASRYEVRSKGIDIFIKALSRLNETLKKENAGKNIVAFFWVPTGVRGIKPEIIENRTLFNDIEDSLKDNAEHVMWRLLSTFVGDKPIVKETIFKKEFLAEIKKKVIRFKRDEMKPPICTHDLIDPNDAITRMLQENGLTNDKEDKVKVLFYPIYLTGADGLIDLNYYEAMQGAHLGVFPSFYEPWGYTPLEAGALGVCNITTDLAGFGRYIQKHKTDDCLGICVLNRMGVPDDKLITDLYTRLYKYAVLPKKKRVENKLEARKLADLADWDLLIKNYVSAENLAIEKAEKDRDESRGDDYGT